MVRSILLTFVVLSTLPGCRKNAEENFCAALNQALVKEDETGVGEFVTSICITLPRSKGKDDLLTRRAQIVKLVQQLDGGCGVTATLLCFECIETLPPITEIKLEYSLNGQPYYRVIDVAAVYDGVPRYVGMHE